MFQFNLPRASL